MKPNLTIFFPVYNDERTVRTVTEKALKVCEEIANEYEIIIINDGSPDNSGLIADDLAKEYSKVKVIHHPKNLGYGAAVKSGFKASKYEWVCFTDGDDEYELNDVKRLVRLIEYFDLIITFRYKKIYSTKRIFISYVYNAFLRWIFRTNYRDISTGLRMVRKSVINEIALTTDSPFIGAELTIKIMLNGYRVGEVGIQTFPRQFGSGSSTSFKNILITIRDMRRIHLEIFSDKYNLPENRERS